MRDLSYYIGEILLVLASVLTCSGRPVCPETEEEAMVSHCMH